MHLALLHHLEVVGQICHRLPQGGQLSGPHKPKYSADLSQSESVLAYIVINQYLAILRFSKQNHSNPLQSPILQIAIYIYCRMHLALSHHLKGVGQICHRLPQGGTGCHRLPNFPAPQARTAWKCNENL